MLKNYVLKGAYFAISKQKQFRFLPCFKEITELIKE